MQNTLARPAEVQAPAPVELDAEAVRPDIERIADELLTQSVKDHKVAKVAGSVGTTRGREARESRAWSLGGQID